MILASWCTCAGPEPGKRSRIRAVYYQADGSKRSAFYRRPVKLQKLAGSKRDGAPIFGSCSLKEMYSNDS